MKDNHLENGSNILVLNPGSSSLKWSVHNAQFYEKTAQSDVVAYEDLGTLLKKLNVSQQISIAVIRFVHGGNEFYKATLISAPVLERLEALNELAPLHNPKSIQCVRTVNCLLPGLSSCYAVFDTEFFNRLPVVSQTYGLPYGLTEKYSIRRYGFHGFAHESMLDFFKSSQNMTDVITKPLSRLITIQLGSGCSMAAIKDGIPIDTTMGFTPNDGLLMATRSGDIDPGILIWLQRHAKLSLEEVDELINLRSGLLGISCESSNMKTLLKSQSKLAELAVDIFCWRIRKTIGAYFAILGGLDSIILSGGIAENSLPICKRVLTKLNHLGIELSSVNSQNRSHIRLTTIQSVVECWLVKNSESQSILRSVEKQLNSKR